MTDDRENKLSSPGTAYVDYQRQQKDNSTTLLQFFWHNVLQFVSIQEIPEWMPQFLVTSHLKKSYIFQIKILIRKLLDGITDPIPGKGSEAVASSSRISWSMSSRTWGKYSSSLQLRAIRKAWIPRLKKIHRSSSKHTIYSILYTLDSKLHMQLERFLWTFKMAAVRICWSSLHSAKKGSSSCSSVYKIEI